MDHIYKYFRWLSLDVVMGAIFFLCYLERLYAVEITATIYVALGSAIWLIYTADHLIDARKVVAPSGGRHRFHQQHFSLLVLVGSLVLIAALVNVVFLPVQIIRGGALLSAACVAYLVVVYLYKKLWIKELLVAIVYAAGIFLAPVTMTATIRDLDVFLVVQLAEVAFLNLLVFSHFDARRDSDDGFGSLAIRMGPTATSVVVHSVCIVSLAISTVSYLATGLEIEVIFLLMNLVLYALYLLPVFHSRGELFRTIGDGIFFLPLIFIL